MSVRTKLNIMMFLEFFIWGAWLPLIFAYLPALGFTALQIGLILATFNASALIGMFFSNQFADRTFAAEKFLSFSHLVGGAAMIGLFWVAGPKATKDDPLMTQLSDPNFLAFFGLMLLHSLFYVPTISITNSIAFANLKDPQKQFGPVRLWGTIGWIAAAWPFVFILTNWAKVPAFGSVGITEWLGAALGTPLEGQAMIAARASTFLTAGIASVLLAAFSLALPHTPPKQTAGSDSLAWLEAAKLLRYPFLLVLFVVTFIDSAVHQYYFYYTPGFLENGVGIPGNWITPVMSIGQIAEIATMAVLGLVLKTFGWRATMIVGVLGHAARFAVFAFLPNPYLAVAANLLHGICYAFFFATVYIFVDEYFPKDVRASAQGLFNLLILGVGPIVTNLSAPYLGEFFTVDKKLDFQGIFMVPMFASLTAAVLLLLFFHPPPKGNAATPALDGAGTMGGNTPAEQRHGIRGSSGDIREGR